MRATNAQLSQILIFSQLSSSSLESLQSHSNLDFYNRGEIVFTEGQCIPNKLYALASGSIQISKIAASGKETMMRTLNSGEMFAAPALVGDGIAPATITTLTDCLVLTVEKAALLESIQKNPDIALNILITMNKRLQQLHNRLHGVVSERAITRLAGFIIDAATEYGTEHTNQGTCLRAYLPYYQIARSIGISYEECVRLFKQIYPVVNYHRGGRITIRDWQRLETIRNTNMQSN
jgi:CRP/FNR family transcriptional regulator, cyclic AMP receptor protein